MGVLTGREHGEDSGVLVYAIFFILVMVTQGCSLCENSSSCSLTPGTLFCMHICFKVTSSVVMFSILHVSMDQIASSPKFMH